MSRLPPRAGLGVRAAHYQEVLDHPDPPAWFEVHSENFFAEGAGAAWRVLDRLAERAPLSLHGVGLSLGSVDPLDAAHLDALARLVERYQPAAVSEHLCWGHAGGWHSNELLPLPYTSEVVEHLARRIDQVQQRLGRRILVENVSCYLRYVHDQFSEWDFVRAVCERADCELLLDINNIHVNAVNHGFKGEDFLAGVPAERIREIHLAAHQAQSWGLVDTHDGPVAAAVWALYQVALERFGPIATVVEWDHALPPFADLLAEGGRVQVLLDQANSAGLRSPGRRRLVPA